MARKPRAETVGADEILADVIDGAQSMPGGVELLIAIVSAKNQTAGSEHAALTALETALYDLKRRAETVEEHISDEFRHILDAIKAL